MPGFRKLLSSVFRRLPSAIKTSGPVRLLKTKLSPVLPSNNYPGGADQVPSFPDLAKSLEKEITFSAGRIENEENKAVRDYYRGRKDAFYFIYNAIKRRKN